MCLGVQRDSQTRLRNIHASALYPVADHAGLGIAFLKVSYLELFLSIIIVFLQDIDQLEHLG